MIQPTVIDFMPKERPMEPAGNTGVVPPHMIPFESKPTGGAYLPVEKPIDVAPISVNGQPVHTFKVPSRTPVTAVTPQPLPAWVVPVGALILLYLITNRKG